MFLFRSYYSDVFEFVRQYFLNFQLRCDFIYADRQVVASSNVQIVDMGKTLRLLEAETADAGSYSCKAINVAGNTEKSFFLDVLGE